MSVFRTSGERRIVPRWRDSSRALLAGEMAAIGKRPRPDFGASGNLEDLVADWNERGSLAIAADLVSSAFVLGNPNAALDAAKFMLSRRAEVPRPALAIASAVLEENGISAPTLLAEPSDYRQAVQILRQRLKAHPRNPLGWVNMARHYAILGDRERADRAIRTAIQLAPEDRFVLRSAARLDLHFRDTARAVGRLRGAAVAATDPWLMAADIAISTVAGKSSRVIKPARRLLERQHLPPRHTSELASALATVDVLNGNRKRGRKLFHEALEDPTENSVAQAQWGASKLANFRVSKDHLADPFSHEARAEDFYLNGDWTAALSECNAWHEDEAFSSRPVSFGTFVASVPLQEFDVAAELARKGLVSNPDDPILLNNLAFALASGNHVDEAASEYRKVPATEDPVAQIRFLATGGLIHFRSGDEGRGREGYLAAIDLAERNSQPAHQALASALLAREELRAKTGEAGAALARARSETEKRPEHERRVLKAVLAAAERDFGTASP